MNHWNFVQNHYKQSLMVSYRFCIQYQSIILSSMENTILNFQQLRCDSHPSERLNNFCLNETCLQALCATCICSHTQSHVVSSTQPKYVALKKLHQEYHSKIFEEINNLNSVKGRLRTIIGRINSRSQEISKTLNEAKALIMQDVQKSFDEIFTRFQRQIILEEKLNGVRSIDDLEDLEKIVINHTDMLFEDSQELNSSNFISAVQKTHNETLKKCSRLFNEIGKLLHKNQEFQASINFRKQQIQDVSSAVKKIFSLQFKYPHLTSQSLSLCNQSSWETYNRNSYSSKKPVERISNVSMHSNSNQLSRNSSINSNQILGQRNSSISINQGKCQRNSSPITFHSNFTENRSHFREKGLQMKDFTNIPLFGGGATQENLMSKHIRRSRNAPRRSQGINLISIEDISSQASKENNTWVL